TAAFKNTGTSGNVVPLLDASDNTFSGEVRIQTDPNLLVRMSASTASFTVRPTAASGAAQINFDPVVTDGASSAICAFFRNSSTTGTGTSFIFYQADGTSALNHRIYAKGGYVCGAPTGGEKGIGSINAQAVYDDNTLLSCYVFDAAIDGEVSLE